MPPKIVRSARHNVFDGHIEWYDYREGDTWGVVMYGWSDGIITWTKDRVFT